MASFTSEDRAGKDFRNFNISAYYPNVFGGFYSDNTNFEFNGRIYEDTISLYLDTGYDVTFGGSGITADSNYAVLSGTLTGLIEFNAMGGFLSTVLQDFSISAVDFYNAAITPSTADDLLQLDTILAGDDIITLASGPDYAYGRGGNDLISSASGNDTLMGEDGNDTLIAAGGEDSLYGGIGYDSINGGAGNDWIDGGAMSDRLNGAGGDDVIYGQTGLDIIYGGLGHDTIDGGLHRDIIYGHDGADSLVGGDGNDSIYGGNQADRLFGGVGDDMLVGGPGIDVMSGGDYSWSNNRFEFNVNDFGPGLRTGVDRITDFKSGPGSGDWISLFDIDASTTAAGNNAFIWIGTAAFVNNGVGGTLRYVQEGGNTYVEGERNGDGLADFAIRLDGLHTLVAADFSL